MGRAMKKWHADEVGAGIDHQYGVDVYLASDVDARIAALERELDVRKAAIEAQFRLMERVKELEEQVATLERSNKRLRQKLDRAVS
jgi:hypothetical protein